jgi:hypothetical protein
MPFQPKPPDPALLTQDLHLLSVPDRITVGGVVYSKRPVLLGSPSGTMEVWFSEIAGWVYLGNPDSPPGDGDESEHDCDVMGCSGGGLHVLARLSP